MLKCSKPFFLSHPWYLEVEDWPWSIEWRHQLCHHKRLRLGDNNKLLPCSRDSSIPKISGAGRAWRRLGLFSCWQQYLHCPTNSGGAEKETSWSCFIMPQCHQGEAHKWISCSNFFQGKKTRTKITVKLGGPSKCPDAGIHRKNRYQVNCWPLARC